MERPQNAVEPAKNSKGSLRTYAPLIAILSVILLLSLALQASDGIEPRRSMRYFMGLFFLFFGTFKLLDWKGFANAFGEYDLLAMRSKAYAYAYPWIELLLSVLYLGDIAPMTANFATITIMAVGSAGVYKALSDKKRVRCACLGVVVKLPMTTVTLIEDVGMGLMAFVMLFF